MPDDRERRLVDLFEAVRRGECTPLDALARWQLDHAKAAVGAGRDAKPDLTRAARLGYPEVVFGEGKSPDLVLRIVEDLRGSDAPILVTRSSRDHYDRLSGHVAEVVWHEQARAITIGSATRRFAETVAVVCAGSTDIPVAEEAIVTIEAIGAGVERFYDVGVAGLHRVLGCLDDLRRCAVVVVVAGMEGALPSVIGGLVAAPVIAVPTSVGYGANLGGFAALLAMLNSCAPGVVTVNIDNGFGAGFAAGRWILAHGMEAESANE